MLRRVRKENKLTEKKKIGLANLSPERRREIASMGGKAAPNNFKNNREFASEMGKKSGRKPKPRD